MNRKTIQSLIFALLLLAGVSAGGAATITVGPSGQYTDVCQGIKAASAGDTVTIDYNNGIPYTEPAAPSPNGGTRSDCVFFANNLTIVGVNGRPVLDATGENLEKGIFDTYGANDVISNLEMMGATATNANGHNAAAVRVDIGGTSSPAGGNITIQECYIHDNQDGVLTGNVGPQYGSAYYSTTPFITFQYDEFYHNGTSQTGDTHNMYIGYDENFATVFTLQYSWTHDAQDGHEVKTRDPQNNIQYNLDTDELGLSSYLLDFPSGGSTYVLGNSFYKAATNQGNKSWMVWRDVSDNTPSDPEYDVPHQDMHFINNSVVLDPQDEASAFVILSCNASDVSQCPAPGNGPVLATNAVVENNIFIGPPSLAVNQTTAHVSNNVIEPYSSSNLAAMFVDWAHFDFHLAAGSPAINAGLYPPTDNTGAADPKAVAHYEYVQPVNGTPRPTPTGSTMDAGAYSYPRSDTPPTPSLTYSQNVQAPGSGTITISNLPLPAAGRYNDASFVVSDTTQIAPISLASSTTGTITTSFQVLTTATGGTVPVDIYVDGAHVVANITIQPGPPILSSITLDGTYAPFTTVHLEGPAPAGGTVINLSSSDPTYLYVPPTVTVPAGAVSAETGSNTGSLWGQTPPSVNETITATQGSVTKSLVVNVITPGIHSCGSYVGPNPVVGGQQVAYQVTMRGYFPASGGYLNFTSDNPAVIPNQSFLEYGSFDEVVYLNTNAVSTNSVANIYLNVNGQTISDHEGTTCTAAITVTPGTGEILAVNSGNQQTATVDTNFASPLSVVLTNNGSPISGTVVTFAGSGVSFPNGATATTNASGVASVAVQPTTTGALLVTATAAGVSGSATFSETGNGGTPAGIAVLSGSGQSSAVGLNFANSLVAQVKDASGNPVSGVSVTFAGSGVSFPNGATVTTDSNGNASIAAQPTTTGPLTVTASAGGVGSTANFSETGTPVATTDVIAIDAGGPAAGNFAADEYGSGGATATTTNTIDLSGVTNPAPEAVYQSERYHAFTYAIPGLTPGASYTVRLHFADFANTGTGQREFNVVINNNQVLTNFDIIAAAGAPNKAVVEPFTAVADSTGAISIYFTFGLAGSPQVSGIEILTGTPTPTVTAVSGSGQTAAVGTSFTNPLVVLVKDASGNVEPGATVTFAGTGVSFPNGATATTDANGNAQIVAQPTSVGPLTITASVSGSNTPASFSETGTAGAPASVAAASGSGQSAPAGTPFASPLVVLVSDAQSNPVSGVTVTFAGSGVSFPNGATAVTGSNGQASVTAEPTTTGPLTISASVAGVTTPASFSETGTVAAALVSITQDNGSYAQTTVHLNVAAPAGGVVVQLMSSDASIVYAPTTVTIPAGQTTAEAGTLPGSLWGQSPYSKSTTVTASYNGVSKSVKVTVVRPTFQNISVASVTCSAAQCSSLEGGNTYNVNLALAGNAPPAGAPVTLTSSNTAVIANTSGTIAAGPGSTGTGTVVITTAAVTKPTNVTLTEKFNGLSVSVPVTVNPSAKTPASIAAVSGGGQSANIGSNFANPLMAVVKNSSGNPVAGATVTFAGANVSFPNGATATTDTNGDASVAAQPTATGPLTVVASVAGVSTSASFSETGTNNPVLSSITSDSPYNSGTTVHLSAPALAGGAVISLATSDATIEYVPATVTVPAGQTSAETGSLLGSFWGQSPFSKQATVIATYGSVTKSLTFNVPTASLHAFNPNGSVQGGQPLPFYMETSFNMPPPGGGPYTISSDQPSIIPTQQFTLAQGQVNDFGKTIATNPVATATTVNVTINYNGATQTAAVSVTP